MTTAYTSLLGLALPVTGELSGTWGDTVNTAITSLLDTAVAGTTSITTDADITLTTTTGASNQARQAIILWNPASGTVTRNITAPAQSKLYTVINASGGTQSIVIRGVGPTTGVTIAKGESAMVAWNGSDFVKVSSSGGAITFTDLTVTGNTILGDAAADTLTVNATSTFAAPVNFQGLVKLPSTGRSAAAALTVTAPAFLYGVASTYTDTTSSGTIAAMAPFYSIAQPTLSTSNVTTYTNAATLYIANAPAAGGSATITNPYALYSAAGANYFGGATTFNSTTQFNGVATHSANLLFSADNTYDIGANGANRPRTGYFGTSVNAPLLVGSPSASSNTAPPAGGLFLSAGGVTSGYYSPAIVFDVGGGGGMARLYTIRSNAAGGSFFIDTQNTSSVYLPRFNVDSDGNTYWTNVASSAGAIAMSLTANGLGVGVNSAAAKLDVRGDSSSTTAMVGAYIYNSNSTTNSQSGIGFFNYDNFGAKIYSPRSSSAAGSLVFATNNGNGIAESNLVEAMRINSGQNVFTSNSLTVGFPTNPGARFAVVSTEAKTSAATPMIFSTSTAGSADFQLVFSRSAAGAGAYYKIQSVEQSTGYRDLVLQVDGGNVGIRTSAPGYTLQLGTLGTGVQYTMYIPGTFNWDGAYLQPGTSGQRGAALILASHTNVSNATGYKFLADNDSVARQLQLQYASDATSLSGASFSTKFWFDGASASPAIGIGKAPSYPLDVAGTVNATGLQMQTSGGDFLLRRGAADGYAMATLMQKSRGSTASPSPVNNGDGVGVIYFQPYVSSSGYLFTASIQAQVNGSVTSTSAPTDLSFSTGSTTLVEAMHILGSNQYVGIKTSAPTNMLDVSGAIGKDYTSNVTVPTNNTATVVLDAFNGQNFSSWIQANFYGVGNNRWTGIISVEWDTGNCASAATFAIAKHSGFNGVNITQLAATNYNGATTTDGSYIYIRNNGGTSVTPVFTFILTASS